MLNDREDKYEGDDTEYHFSDEEINYDMDESETPKTAAPVAPESKSAGGGGLLKSKRMVISGAVFVALVLVVYKMVSPSSSTSDVNIDDMKSVPVMAQDATPAVTAQGYNSKATVNKVPVSAPASVSRQATQIAAQPTQLASQPSVTMPVMPTTPAYSQQPAPVSQPQQMPTMPSMPSMPSGPAQPVIPALASQQFVVPGTEGADSKVVTLAAQNQRLMEQLQSQYDERIKAYQDQNRNLQEQLQTLTTKVSGMENQLTEMTSRHTKKPQAADESPSPSYVPSSSPRSEAQPKIPYNVQAIIPGRAWLKSDNGETLTVAEGDVVKGLGRITKIDPYDGVVEINTGKRVVALSYGNGG